MRRPDESKRTVVFHQDSLPGVSPKLIGPLWPSTEFVSPADRLRARPSNPRAPVAVPPNATQPAAKFPAAVARHDCANERTDNWRNQRDAWRRSRESETSPWCRRASCKQHRILCDEARAQVARDLSCSVAEHESRGRPTLILQATARPKFPGANESLRAAGTGVTRPAKASPKPYLRSSAGE